MKTSPAVTFLGQKNPHSTAISEEENLTYVS